MSKSSPGILLVVSGPSGAGKTTLCERLCADDPRVVHSISCTTRKPRAGEKNGIAYFFLSVGEFLKKAEAGEFLEHAVVHGNHYGTLLGWVREKLESGVDVVMDIDVQGADQIRNHPDPFIADRRADMFIYLSEEEVLARLEDRGSESKEQLETRLANSREELSHWPLYQYVIPSRSRDEDYARFRAIIEGERGRP
ncbi:MAG: guanylate kinase [Verrucomicrobiota bacterium]